MDLETVLVLDRDRDAATRAANALASAGRLVLTGCDAVLGNLIMTRIPVASMVTDVGISGPFSFEGLDVVADARRAAPQCRIVVTGDEVSPKLSAEALRRGATEVLPRPFDDAQLRLSVGQCSGLGDGGVLHIPTLDELIDSTRLSPAFQAIVDLAHPDKAGHGFESLARYREAALPFYDPCFMFEYARLRGRTDELELACLRRTMRQAHALPENSKIFVNIHPHVLSDGDKLSRTLVKEANDGGVPLSNIVLEITEQEKLGSGESVMSTIEELRALGVTFALDDVGISYSHLERIDRIQPRYLKISQEFGTDFEKNSSRQKIIRNILSLAHDFDCEVVLEGIETAATSQAATDIGARYAQGYYFARPE
jgi:EAL domain-containing protein (putative c-di-GMP-specific phosphodiesterase class I)